MFIDQTASSGLLLQRSAMVPAMNRGHRPRSAPLEREEFLGLAFHEHYVPKGGQRQCRGY